MDKLRGLHVGKACGNDLIPAKLIKLGKDALCYSLTTYCMSLQSCNYIRIYLMDRRQRVEIGSHRSEWLTVLRGVPQGSLAGPVLFNMFINYLIMSLSQTCDIYNYADDNTLAHRDQD